MSGLPEGYLPRRGDLVVLHAEIVHDVRSVRDGTTMRIVGQGSTHWVDFKNVIALRRRTWNPGEPVKHKNAVDLFGEVAAMVDDSVWVKLDPKANQKGSTAGFRTFHCNEIVPNPTAVAAMVDAEDSEEIAEIPPAPLTAPIGEAAADEEEPIAEEPEPPRRSIPRVNVGD